MHIEKATLQFLKDLAKNNNRPWFKKHDEEYRAAKENIENVTAELITRVSRFDDSIKGLTPKECMFRIHRDARFSKDKTPYKVNFSSHINPGGRKSFRPGYYFHVEPGASFLAGGMYRPTSEQLANVRKSISRNSAPLRKIINSAEFKKHFEELRGDQVKTAPRGYAKNHPDIDLLRFKGFIAWQDITEKDVLAKDFPEKTAKVFKAAKPLMDWLSNAAA